LPWISTNDQRLLGIEAPVQDLDSSKKGVKVTVDEQPWGSHVTPFVSMVLEACGFTSRQGSTKSK
jgi:hypothetical protein